MSLNMIVQKWEVEDGPGNAAIAAALGSHKASVEKVKVKASLRSKMTKLEMVEERGKLAIALAYEEENKSSLAVASRLKIVLEEASNIAAMGSLRKSKRKIVKKQEEVRKEVKELEERRRDSEKLTADKVKEWMEKIEIIQEELKIVDQELQLVEGRSRVNRDLEKFMERQIKELREELECPVCLEVTTKAPIYKCTDDHIVCKYCWVFLSNSKSCKSTNNYY